MVSSNEFSWLIEADVRISVVVIYYEGMSGWFYHDCRLLSIQCKQWRSVIWLLRRAFVHWISLFSCRYKTTKFITKYFYCSEVTWISVFWINNKIWRCFDWFIYNRLQVKRSKETPSSKLVKFLLPLVQLLEGKSPTFVKNSRHFIGQEIMESYIVSFDI